MLMLRVRQAVFHVTSVAFPMFGGGTCPLPQRKTAPVIPCGVHTEFELTAVGMAEAPLHNAAGQLSTLTRPTHVDCNWR